MSSWIVDGNVHAVCESLHGQKISPICGPIHPAWWQRIKSGEFAAYYKTMYGARGETRGVEGKR